jgi:hypothetical protein
MQKDPFTGYPSSIQGGGLPGEEIRAGLQNDHQRRLATLAQLSALAAECGVATDPDRDLVTLPEDAISLLELADPWWAELGKVIRQWRDLVPLCRLEDFGFPEGPSINLEEGSPRLRYLHSGVEASAFVAIGDASIYKFYRPVEGTEKLIGSTFAFHPDDERLLEAEARPGSYRDLFEKILLIDALGMPTEVMGVTSEGILVVKQTVGEPLPQGEDMSERLPPGLIEIPSRFLRANRDHPRLYFLGGRAWLVADLHARNFVRCGDGSLRVIDLVAAPWPMEASQRYPLIGDWLGRMRVDPTAGLLRAGNDDEL